MGCVTGCAETEDEGRAVDSRGGSRRKCEEETAQTHTREREEKRGRTRIIDWHDAILDKRRGYLNTKSLLSNRVRW